MNTGASHSTNFSSGIHTTNPSLGNHNQPAHSGFQANHSNFQANHSAFQGNHFSAVHGNQMVINHGGSTQIINAHNYHNTYIGNQSIRLAGAGYRPSYYGHGWYHGPWAGNSWGWGWGLGAGFGYGLGGYGWGIGIGSGWGYGGFGYGGFGGYGPYGPYGYWGRPLGWGFGGWGLGMMAYNSGYYPYYNPYYYPSTTVVYNYANPLPVATNVAADPGAMATVDNSGPPPTPQSDNPAFDAARAAFREGNYDAALANVDAAISKTPTDSVFHEFRALTLFAMQDYKQAAGVVHSLLAVGPGSGTGPTMSSLYADPDAYTQQLRTLEQYVLDNPKAADARTSAGLPVHGDRTLRRGRQPVAAGRQAHAHRPARGRAPADGARPAEAGDTGHTTRPNARHSRVVTPRTAAARSHRQRKSLARLVERSPDGSNFALTLTDDGKFTWKFTVPKQKGDEFSGTYTTDGAVLVLQRDGGGGERTPRRRHVRRQRQVQFPHGRRPAGRQGTRFRQIVGSQVSSVNRATKPAFDKPALRS